VFLGARLALDHFQAVVPHERHVVIVAGGISRAAHVQAKSHVPDAEGVGTPGEKAPDEHFEPASGQELDHVFVQIARKRSLISLKAKALAVAAATGPGQEPPS